MLRSNHLLAMVVSVVAAGCSASRYDADYATRIAAFRADAEFAELDAIPRELAGGRVRVNFPMKFVTVEDESSRKTSLGLLKGIDDAVIFNTTLKGTNGVESCPVVVAAAVPTTKRRSDDLRREIDGWMKQDDQFKNLKWDLSKKVAASKGGPSEWAVLKLDGDQDFEAVVPAGSTSLEEQRMKGAGEIWVSASADRDYCVLICVRMPNDVASQFRTSPAQLAELMARRVEILPPPADPAAK